MAWFRRNPDFIIGSPDRPYMLRWYLIPRNRWFNVYLHKIVRDDDDRALHDHPWWSVSLLLRGKYIEVTPAGLGVMYRHYGLGSVIIRRPTHRHRLELPEGKPAWTLFFTGPKVRTWGFWCPRGFVPWHEFVNQNDRGNTGRGCGET